MKGGYPPRGSTTSAVGASPPLAGKKPVEESPAKVLLPEGGYLLGTSTPTAAMTPAKLASLSGAEDDVAYERASHRSPSDEDESEGRRSSAAHIPSGTECGRRAFELSPN